MLVYAEPGGPWRIAGESGLVGDGSGRYHIPLLERPVLGLRFAIVDMGTVTGGGPPDLGRGAARWAGLPIDIGEPGNGLAVEGGPTSRVPVMLEPAPAWRAPLLAAGVAGLLGLAALRVRRRRAQVAVP